MLPILYHYTCDHSRAEITDTLEPAIHLMGKASRRAMRDDPRAIVAQLVWLTDIPWITVLNAHRVGLTRLSLLCDRTQNRYRVTDTANIQRWIEVRERWQIAGRFREVINILEHAPGADPAHWYVSAAPVPVVLDMHKKEQASK